MNDLTIGSFIDKVISGEKNAKLFCIILIAVLVVFAGVCYWYTGKINNPGTEFAEEIIEEVIKKETGIDIEQLLPPSKHSRDD